jgi:hypothetical protein
MKAAVALFAAAVCLVAPALARADDGELSPAQLLAQYQPVTVLDARERFRPSAVEPFITGSVLEQQTENGWVAVDTSPDPGRLPVHDASLRLNVPGCTSAIGVASVACYAGAISGPSVVYGRYHVEHGTTVLQYWYFYPDDFWSLQYPPSDLIWQAHEGDWEVVTILLDESGTPQEVGYSRHCNGIRRAWDAVPKWVGTTHPIDYVAIGSHANELAPGVQPIDTSCYPNDVRDFFAANHLTPFDFDFGGVVDGPAERGLSATEIQQVHENAPRWLRFEGAWGEGQFIHAPAPLGTIPLGPSPVGPQQHEVWQDPLGTIASWPLG